MAPGFEPQVRAERQETSAESHRPQTEPPPHAKTRVVERWQNGNALASKASARKGLGVRIPRAPYNALQATGLEGILHFGGVGQCAARARFWRYIAMSASCTR